MGTSLGAAIDYICTGTNPSTHTTLAVDLAAVDEAALLVDNVPTKSSRSMVFVGRANPDDAEGAAGSQKPVTLGVGTVDEEFSIPCYISVSRPGPEQKPARDAALALFDAFSHWLAADRTLGGALKGGRYAELSTITLVQTLDPEDSGGAGGQRSAWVMFDVLARSHYTP